MIIRTRPGVGAFWRAPRGREGVGGGEPFGSGGGGKGGVLENDGRGNECHFEAAFAPASRSFTPSARLGGHEGRTLRSAPFVQSEDDRTDPLVAPDRIDGAENHDDVFPVGVLG